jgi:multiple sugar transport system permease protein
MDGASRWQSFLTITLPLLRPVIFIAMIFRGIDALKTFDSIAVITSGGPGTATETLNFYIYNATFQYQRMGYASALLVVYLILVLSVLLVMLRFRRARG